MRNPFADDIFSGEETGARDAAALFQAEALQVLRQRVPEEEGGAGLGRALVVTAARAGFGKSHLMSVFGRGLRGRALVVPLTFDLESPPSWSGIFWGLVEKLHRDESHRSGLSLLDETARFLLARVNQRLIRSGAIPCAHPAEAVASLERNYLEMFDFTDPGQAVARWFSEHFEHLIMLSAAELAEEARVEPERVAHWLRVLVAYAQGAGELPGRRWESLRWAAGLRGGGGGLGGGSLIVQEGGTVEQRAKEDVRDLGRLLGLHRPAVFVIDHLDGFYRDGAAGLRIGYFVSELRRLLPRSLSVVCVNQDVWQSTFMGQLPSALEDRMSEGMVTLSGLSGGQAEHLVDERLVEAGLGESERAGFLEWLRLDEFLAGHGGRGVSPRAVLRYAAACWERRLTSGGAVEPSGGAGRGLVLVPGEPAAGAGGALAGGVDWGGPGGVRPASSVVGEETLDSISVALQAMVAGEGGERSGQRPSGSFQRLRENLDRLRPAPDERRPGAGGAGGGAGGGAVAAASPLARAFAEQLRRRTESPVAPALDLERLGQVLRFAGAHFPVVRAEELGVPGTSGTAIQWLSPDAEILIGLESSTRPIFWSALTAHAAARVRLNGGLPVKVVAFMEEAEGLHPAEQGRPAGGYTIDLVTPTVSDLRELAAAGDVLEEIEAGRLEADEQEVATLLVQELEPFWRRLTRLAAGHPA